MSFPAEFKSEPLPAEGDLLAFSRAYWCIILYSSWLLTYLLDKSFEGIPLGFHVPSTTTNESRRLIGGFLGFHLPSTTTNES